MKVFLSWSGIRSHAIAEALREWLPSVLQAIDPWLSSTDIEAGARWENELRLQLEEARVGIVCLTPENLSAPWLLYEIGALSKTLETAYVCPYLFGFSPSRLSGPLVQFQATTATRDGTFALLTTLNRALGQESLDRNRLQHIFDVWWPELEKIFRGILGDQRHAELEPSREKVLDTPAHKVTDQASPEQLLDLLQQVVKQLSGAGERQVQDQAALPSARVFVVHGRNQVIKEDVARFIEQLGIAAIILHEQPDKGRTIIEKLEDNTAVDYAVVLLTGDDAGGLKDAKVATPPLRARQNVIFELGFFAAKLGRSRVAVLIEEGVEMPSDYSGIPYIKIDAQGSWKYSLAREFKTAGLRVDLNIIAEQDLRKDETSAHTI